MKTYTATQLKNKTGDVLHDTQMDGAVVIRNRSRPDMVMITKDRYDTLMENIDKKYDDSIAGLEASMQKRIDSGTIDEFMGEKASK